MPLDGLAAILAESAPVAGRFVDAGHRVFLVGGIVRDLWLDRRLTDSLDLDLTTDAHPDQTKEIVGPIADALWLQGERFGTIGAHVAGRPYEITTHRAESYVAHSRKPDVHYATAIEEDLSRRDFTINAMAIELPAGELIDPFEGARDLRERRLRTPLDPEVSFTDDPLRMLRAARFTAGYGLVPVPELTASMRALAGRLDIVSAERVRDELDKLLAVDEPSSGLMALASAGLLAHFLPEVDQARLEARRVDVDKAPSRPDLRLALLLAGTDRSAVRQRLGALRASRDRLRYTDIVLAGAEAVAGRPTVPPAYRRWYVQVGAHREDAMRVARALDAGFGAVIDEMEAVRSALGTELDDFSLPLDGNEIIDILGVEEGRAVGDAVAHLAALRYDEGPLDKAAARAALESWWSRRQR